MFPEFRMVEPRNSFCSVLFEANALLSALKPSLPAVQWLKSSERSVTFPAMACAPVVSYQATWW
jgi:hypothetical protein